MRTTAGGKLGGARGHGRALASWLVLTACGSLPAVAQPATGTGAKVESLEIRILSTMLAEAGIGEWGFAALVEADGRRLLFDTGARPGTVLSNARELGVDLSGVGEVVLSHHHADHTGGLVTLRRELMKRSPQALAQVHVARGIFWERLPGSDDPGSMPGVRQGYEALGGRFVEHAAAVELYPGVWLTGPVPRVHDERNWSGSRRVRTPDGIAEDTIPESQSLVIDAPRGLVVVSGCGHAGLINTLDYARAAVRPAPIHVALGGFHLFDASDAQLAWTAGELQRLGLGGLVGAHCTGLEAVYRLRALVGSLSRETAVVGAVGASFSLAGGIEPLALAR